MVLVLPTSGRLEDTGLLEALMQDPKLKAATAVFLSRHSEQPLAASCRSACALMGEQALVDFSVNPWHIGSSDATTCLIVVAVDFSARKAWAAHYNSTIARHDRSIVDLLPQHMRQPDLWLVGSFSEESGESAATLHHVLEQLQGCSLPFQVRLACVDMANTRAGGGPCALSLTVACLPSGDGRDVDASPTGFIDRGPELPRRFAHDHLAAADSDGSHCLRHIVDTDTSRLKIPGLRCRRVSPIYVQYYASELHLPDAVFLRRHSTSPDYEPPNFVKDVKDAYDYIFRLAAAEATVVPDAWFEWEGMLSPNGQVRRGAGDASRGWQPFQSSEDV